MSKSYSVLCFCALEIIIFFNHAVFTQEKSSTIRQLREKGVMGLGDDFQLRNCSTVMDCSFLIICPSTYKVVNNSCVKQLPRECPSISTLNYTIHPFDRIITLPNKTDPENIRTQKTKTCRYEVNDFTSLGNDTDAFNLTFDFAENTLTLNTSRNIDEEYIKCFANNESISIRYLTDMNDDLEDNFSYYNLPLDSEPNEYYCYIDAPTILKPKISDRVFAYPKTPHTKYIIKVSASNFDYSRLLKSYCNINQLDQCKLMKMEHNTSYYFFRDALPRDTALIKGIIERAVVNLSAEDLIIRHLRIVDYCESEITGSYGNNTLHWMKTLIGTIVTSEELCFDKYGKQVTRKCIGSFLEGAYWDEPSAPACYENSEIANRTLNLYNYIRDTSANKTLSYIVEASNDYPKLTAEDINLISLSINSTPIEKDVLRYKVDFFQSIENTMRAQPLVLSASQKRYNSTDRLLDEIDCYMTNLAQESDSINYTIKSNLLVQITYPSVSKVIGMALYNNNGSRNFSEYNIVNIYENETINDLTLENLEVAVYIPIDIIDNLTRRLSAENRSKFKLVNTIFYNDSLFNEGDSSKRPVVSRIINVKIPGFEGKIPGSIPLLFRPIMRTNLTNCVYWNYGQQKSGRWSKRGGSSSNYNDNLVECYFTHLTHFALLVLSENLFTIQKTDHVIGIKEMMRPHDAPLTAITLIGCSFSVLGIVAIIFTAISFKGWYIRRINTIQLSMIMLLEIIMLFIADVDDLKKGVSCKFIAIILHYVVLAKFTWMLLIGRIQYLKFIKILPVAQINAHNAVYNSLGWVLPAVPVAISFLIFPDSYTTGLSNFCYVKDNSLHYFLILPASIVILLNVVVFVMIMINISQSKCKEYGTNIYKLQIRLAILLFFMLGVTWFFGIVGEILPVSWLKLTCIYIFCMLASIQGFIMFIFNIVLDVDTRCFWMDCFNSLQSKGARFKNKI